MLKDLIHPSQASFIPGRQSLDNIVICQELVHTLGYTKAKKGGMILKIDLEKAYDLMSWSFVEEILKDPAFPIKVVEVIMNMLRQSSSRLLWNGEMTEQISHTRGLRQGDPLSPYLFVMCLERLSHWIRKKVVEGSWKPQKASRGGKKISHLFLQMICYSLHRRLWTKLIASKKD